MNKRIAIIGAGISGLALSYALRNAGYEVVVFEARSRAGGPIHTFERDGYRIETGPHSLLMRHQSVADLLDELGLTDDIVDADANAERRFIVRNGEPVPLPSSPIEAITTPLLSKAGRLRVLAEPFIGRTAEGAIDETLASFVARRLGPEFLEYLVDPFVGGVWAGDPHRLSAQHSFPTLVELERSGGSIAIGALKKKLSKSSDDDTIPRRLISFRDGMKSLVDALSEPLGDDLRLETPVRKLRRDDDGWRVIFARGKARRGETFDAVVSTIPPDALARLEWENVDPPRPAIDELARMPYAPCCVVSLGIERELVGHKLDGFGCLVPRVEQFHILGSLFVSSMFPGRAPDGRVLLSVFIGGARQPELCDADDQTLVEMARHDLGRLLDLRGAAEFSHITRWDRAIPQYDVGHQVFLDSIAELEEELPQIYFAGNYRDHIGLPNILRESRGHFRRIDDELG